MIIKKQNEADALVAGAVELGAGMLVSGAEINRVEDSITRILSAYGAEKINVFAITYVIDVTVYIEGLGYVCQSRRISGFSNDLTKLELLNDLSRSICREQIAPGDIGMKVREIMERSRLSAKREILGNAVISSSFTLFFGGSFIDAVISGIIGILIYFFNSILGKWNINRFLSTCICAAIAGMIAVLLHKAGIGDNPDMVSIGNIMILIPGLMITNSFREMFTNNITSGNVRFLESLLLSISIAVGMGFIYIISMW